MKKYIYELSHISQLRSIINDFIHICIKQTENKVEDIYYKKRKRIYICIFIYIW